MKWRKVKKRLKRKFIGKIIGIAAGGDFAGCPMLITNVKVIRVEGRKVRLEYSCKPVLSVWKPIQPVIELYEDAYQKMFKASSGFVPKVKLLNSL